MFTKLVKHQLVEKDLKVSDLARLLNTSYQNLDQKLKRDNFSEKEMLQIADALHLDLKILLEKRIQPVHFLTIFVIKKNKVHL